MYMHMPYKNTIIIYSFVELATNVACSDYKVYQVQYGGEGWLGFPDLWCGQNPWWNWYLSPVVNFGEVRRAQLAKSTLPTSGLGPLGSGKVSSDAKERAGCGKLPHQFISSKTAILVAEFAVEDLSLGRTLWWWLSLKTFQTSREFLNGESGNASIFYLVTNEKNSGGNFPIPLLINDGAKWSKMFGSLVEAAYWITTIYSIWSSLQRDRHADLKNAKPPMPRPRFKCQCNVFLMALQSGEGTSTFLVSDSWISHVGHIVL